MSCRCIHFVHVPISTGMDFLPRGRFTNYTSCHCFYRGNFADFWVDLFVLLTLQHKFLELSVPRVQFCI